MKFVSKRQFMMKKFMTRTVLGFVVLTLFYFLLKAFEKLFSNVNVPEWFYIPSLVIAIISLSWCIGRLLLPDIKPMTAKEVIKEYMDTQ